MQPVTLLPTVLPGPDTPPGEAGSRERGGSPWLGHDSHPSPAFVAWQQLERSLRPPGQRPPPGLATSTVSGAFLDWWMHLGTSLAKQAELAQLGVAQWTRACRAALQDGDALQPLPQDKRFNDPAWLQQPYHQAQQCFLLHQQWWQRATTAVPGVSRHHEQMVSFAARQWLDMVAPSNFLWTNPVLQRRSLQEGGMNLLRGLAHAVEDIRREAADLPPAGAEAFEVGRDLAATPGQVVLRNRLIELIQYTPTTPTVHAEPVLLVPAWIMKYYILDLSPHNSLVRYLVAQGFTVFAISWKNPDSGDRELGMDDYGRLGVEAALRAIRRITAGAQVHGVGYCLGGTLLAIMAAALGRHGDPALRSMTLLAAQTDFSDPGELALFIDEGQVAHLENLMWQPGYLDKRQMKETFHLLRSNDLIWSYRLNNYLLGERQPVNDLMAWNADGTRMPYRMHVEYLRGLFLHNALARGDWRVDGTPVNLDDIHVPIFNVGMVQDHVAPWRSAFKLHAFTDAEQTFVLAGGGHNVGIVNPPGLPKSNYRLRRWHPDDRLLTPDEWLASTPAVAGSWWPVWTEWLAAHSTGRVEPPRLGSPKDGLPALCDAPGTYVHQR